MKVPPRLEFRPTLKAFSPSFMGLIQRAGALSRRNSATIIAMAEPSSPMSTQTTSSSSLEIKMTSATRPSLNFTTFRAMQTSKPIFSFLLSVMKLNLLTITFLPKILLLVVDTLTHPQDHSIRSTSSSPTEQAPLALPITFPLIRPRS